MGGSSAQGGGTNSLPFGTPYLGGTVSGQTTYSGPPGDTGILPPDKVYPPPQPGSAPGGGNLQHPLAGLWAGAMLGSLLSQALFPGNNQPGGQGGPMPGGMMPQGAPSPFGPSGFTPGLRGTSGSSGGSSR